MDDYRIVADPSPGAAYRDYVAGHPSARLYHRPEWSEMVRETFGHPTRYFRVERNGAVEGILPVTDFRSLLFGKLGVSLPFINYGGPLADSDAALAALMEHMRAYRDEAGYKSIELRLDRALETDTPVKTHKVTFYLDLPADPDALFGEFKAKLRSQIRRPTKDDMTGHRGGLDLLDEFYAVFAINMRDLGTPVLPRAFFRNILTTFPEDAHVIVVRTPEGEPAAAAFLLRHGTVMEIPWASAVRTYNRSSPNMLAYWESLQLAIERGCTVFDFGRCSKEGGTYRFKKQWGSRESQLYWYYVLPEGEVLPEMSPDNPKYDRVIRVWQKLPLVVTNAVGPMIIRHIP